MTIRGLRGRIARGVKVGGGDGWNTNGVDCEGEEEGKTAHSVDKEDLIRSEEAKIEGISSSSDDKRATGTYENIVRDLV